MKNRNCQIRSLRCSHNSTYHALATLQHAQSRACSLMAKTLLLAEQFEHLGSHPECKHVVPTVHIYLPQRYPYCTFTVSYFKLFRRTLGGRKVKLSRSFYVEVPPASPNQHPIPSSTEYGVLCFQILYHACTSKVVVVVASRFLYKR
jgi:hypothetical protein